MANKLKLEIKIRTPNDAEKIMIGNHIHEQLRGNPDYINDRIVLNIEVENEVWLGIFEDCEHMPKITLCQ